MGYGNIYSEKAQKEIKANTVVTALCDKRGYTREGFTGTELEAKINVTPKRNIIGITRSLNLSLGEQIRFPAPYLLDNILDVSETVHEVYVSVSERVEEAFTVVKRTSGSKLKIKSNVQQYGPEDALILVRGEQHETENTTGQINELLVEKLKTSPFPIKYLGSFCKKSKEAFIFNPVSGRIFVVATNVCTSNAVKSTLYQVELEYYGQVNGYSYQDPVLDDMVALVRPMILDLPRLGYIGQSSTLTKGEWVMRCA